MDFSQTNEFNGLYKINQYIHWKTNKHRELLRIVNQKNHRRKSYKWENKYSIVASSEASNVIDFMAALAGNTPNTTSYDEFTSFTNHLAVVKNTMAILLPSLPVVGYAAAILEGMDESIHVLNVGVESVSLKASFDPFCHEGGSIFLRSCFCFR
jgi:hypothetical protein